MKKFGAMVLLVGVLMSISAGICRADTDVTVSVEATNLNLYVYSYVNVNGNIEIWLNHLQMVSPTSYENAIQRIVMERDAYMAQRDALIASLNSLSSYTHGLANYTNGKMQVLVNNDAILAKQIGTFGSNSTLAEMIRNGSATIVGQMVLMQSELELTQAQLSDAVRNIMLLYNMTKYLDSQISAVDEGHTLVEIEISSNLTKLDIRVTGLQSQVLEERARFNEFKASTDSTVAALTNRIYALAASLVVTLAVAIVALVRTRRKTP